MMRLWALGLFLASESFAQLFTARERLLKLETRASLLHVTAHPDDEHGGMLTLLSRGQGARVALVSLTRGEAGANAIGPELFGRLGWITYFACALHRQLPYGVPGAYRLLANPLFWPNAAGAS